MNNASNLPGIVLIDGELRIPTKARTKRQGQAIQSLIRQGNFNLLVAYMQTFAGVQRHMGGLKPVRQGHDKLEHKDKGTWLAAMRRLMNYETNHKPMAPFKGTGSSPFIGVEIECFIPYDNGLCELDEDSDDSCEYCGGSGEMELTDDDGDGTGDYDQCDECRGTGRERGRSGSPTANLAALFKEHSITRTTIKYDGSIHPESGCWGVEITVLTRIDEPTNLRRVCELLNKMGARVNKSCGLHVHLDMRNRTNSSAWRIGERIERTLPLLAKCVPETRRNNDYCRLGISDSEDDRYVAVNMNAFQKFKTIEMRLHSATTNFAKIIAWTRLIKAIADAPSLDDVGSISSFEALLKHVNLNAALVAYFKQRMRLFSGRRVHPSVADGDNSDMRLTATKLGVRICDAQRAQVMRELAPESVGPDMALAAASGGN